jgi:prepilin-type N-terminal cleavage/methylation domain-containing protein
MERHRPVPLNKKGFTLVEVLVAFTVLLFVSLAMMQVALVSINSNMANLLRDEAVSIADSKMNDIKSAAYSNWAANTDLIADTYNDVPAGHPEYYRRSFRLFTIDYGVQHTITDLATDVKQVDVVVSWTWKGQDYSHSVTSIMRNPSGS